MQSVRTFSSDMANKAAKERLEAREQAEQEMYNNNPELWQEYNKLTESEKQQVLRKTNKEYQAADDQAQSWGIGGNKSRALNAVTTAITGILGGQTNMQVLTNTLAPYASELIGRKFGHGEDQNKAAQLLAHAILGAVTASVNGGNAAAGAAGATGAELAADYLISQLPKDKYPEAINPSTGEIDPNRLPEEVKSTIRDLSSAVASVAGGITGGNISNAQIAGVAGMNAVENNKLSWKLTGKVQKQEIEDFFHKNMGKKVKLQPKVDKNGNTIKTKDGYEVLDLVIVGDISQLTEKEKIVYEKLTVIINDPENIAKVTIDKDVPYVNTGDYINQIIDLADIYEYDKVPYGMSGIAAIMHEIVEQYEKSKHGTPIGSAGRWDKNKGGILQDKKSDFNKDHDKAVEVQNEIDNTDRVQGLSLIHI